MSGGSGPREWDAETYDRISAPQLEWGREVLARLSLRGDETVIDAGCGSGRVSELLLERLPRGRLICVDGSEAMLEGARERFAAAPGSERVELIRSDLLELELDGVADAVLSTATFHWIAEHDRLFSRVRSWLRPGGRLEAQCGGRGNVAGFIELVDRVASREPFAEHLGGLELYYFAGAEETAARLESAGFSEIECALERRSASPPEPRAFLETVCLGAYLDVLPERLRARFIAEVAELWLDDPLLDYVRLNISARRPA